MKIYDELESLGFFEWLKEKGFGSGFTPIILNSQPFDSIERSGYNAIAFRWFREKYNLHSTIALISNSDTERRYMVMIDYIYPHKAIMEFEEYETYEEAQLECLKKLIEIVKTK